MKIVQNIVLIGMPSAGKSTIGVLLAKELGFSFLDTDLSLQSHAGKRLFQILDEIGKERFLALEEEVIMRIHVSKTVIATGGSAVYSKKAMDHLKMNSLFIYLKVEPEELVKRLGNMVKRGIAISEGQTIEDLFEERRPFYEKYADITIEWEKGNGLNAILNKMIYALQAFISS